MSTTINPLTETSTWSIDPAHSSVHFKVRHMMISYVRGEFRVVRGGLKLSADDITQSSVEAEIDASSIETRDQQRDAHLRSGDFLDTERYPVITFRSTKLHELPGEALRVEGELTIHGVTRDVSLHVDNVSPETKDPWGNLRLAASASTIIRRKDFGLNWNTVLETGGVLVGDDIAIEFDLEFVKSQQ
jgi:polyisoprenoid-binding protein YceI